MPKRIIPENTDKETRFQIVMDGIIENNGELKLPKSGTCSSSADDASKWRFFSEKTDGMTTGFLVKKQAKLGAEKGTHTWIYKHEPGKDYTWFFYEHFGESVGGELFRYVLGDLAPKIRMTQYGTETPGLVSRFIPEFSTFKEQMNALHVQSHLDEMEQEASAKEEQHQKQAFVNNIPTITGIPKIVAANCFFNDFDGKFGNAGTFKTPDGRIKAARIDFGTALSNLYDHTYGLGLYLFGEGEFSDRYHHHLTYRSLLGSETFKNEIEELSNIDMSHVEAIVKTSVARFVKAWKSIELGEEAINKLYTHLYGGDKSMWENKGYMVHFNDPLPPKVSIDLEYLERTVVLDIVTSLAERKEIFAFFAKVLTCQVELNEIAMGEAPPTAPIKIKQMILANTLIVEAIDNDFSDQKAKLISWITGDKLQLESTELSRSVHKL